jgi:energy-coupling factor transport system ATP-binding protein
MLGDEAVVKVKGLWLRYRGNSDWVLRSLNLTVLQGEFTLIIGASGSGKTSLIRALIGVAQNVFGAETLGEVELCSKRLEEMTVDEVQRCVQVVNQDPLTHFLDPLPYDDLLSYAERFYGEKAEDVVTNVLKLLNINDIAEKPITALSGGQLRRLAIAKALIPNPRVLIFDEPLMWLDEEGVELFRKTLKTLRMLRKSVIIAEHRFLRVLDLVDTVYRLELGELKRVDIGMLSSKLHRIRSSSCCTDAQESKDSDGSCEAVVELHNVWYRYGDSPWILKGVSLRVCKGDTIVIFGNNGSGKSTLLRLIAGVIKPVSGSVKVYGDLIYIPQMPYLFITEDSIINEVKSLCKARRLGEDCIRRCVETLKLFGYNDLDKLPLHLSWGQLTRLATLLGYSVTRGAILLDEPFTGSSYPEALRLAKLLNSLRDVAKIVTVSSEDHLRFFAHGKLFRLQNGVLKPCRNICKPFDHSEEEVLLELIKA